MTEQYTKDMKDAVVGVVKSIIDNELKLYNTAKDDISDYIYRIKNIIEGVDNYISTSKELIKIQKQIRNELVDYGKRIWLSDLKPDIVNEKDEKEDINDKTAYYEFLYDHLYEHGEYPL